MLAVRGTQYMSLDDCRHHFEVYLRYIGLYIHIRNIGPYFLATIEAPAVGVMSKRTSAWLAFHASALMSCFDCTYIPKGSLAHCWGHTERGPLKGLEGIHRAI